MGSPWRPRAGCRGQKCSGRARPKDFALWHSARWVWARAQEAWAWSGPKRMCPTSGGHGEYGYPAEAGNPGPSPRTGVQSATPE